MLLSYLFPFIPMDLWVMGSSALLYAADAVLFYRWISKKGLHYGNCLFTSLFFTCSTALLYHSYNQLMFVNYMPFLLLALLGGSLGTLLAMCACHHKTQHKKFTILVPLLLVLQTVLVVVLAIASKQ